VNVLARAFYALGDTRTPMKVSIACLGINLIFSLALVWQFRQGGLGLANTISSAFNVGLLTFALRKKLGRLELSSLRATFPALAAAATAAAIIAWWGGKYWETKMGHATVALKIGAVFVPGGIASLVYLLITLATKVPAASELTGFLFRRARR
jgi:putative peptidoglycan lipid II flippase